MCREALNSKVNGKVIYATALAYLTLPFTPLFKTDKKYMRNTALGLCTWTETTREIYTTPVLDKIQEYSRKWLQQVNRMSRNRLTRIIKNCRPKDRRNQGRPLEILLNV